MEGQRLSTPANRTDLSVDPAEYFGVDPELVENADLFGIEPDPDEGATDLYRVSYVFLLVFGNDDSDTEYGGMQLRAETSLYLDRGAVAVPLQKIIQRAAHRAASMYDTDIETHRYGSQAAGRWGDGYLDGFNPIENSFSYENWEVEYISGQEADTAGQPGQIIWTTEIYNEVEKTDYAELAGKASGIADPWTHSVTVEEGREAITVPGFKWRIGYQASKGDGSYVIEPPAYSSARDRYREGAGQGKLVYVNGRPVGQIEPKGRVWLKPEYSRNPNVWRQGDMVRWSREGLVDETAATYQALRRGGVLYQVGEDEDGVYLRSARALPEGYRPSDPDEVAPDLEVQSGRPPREIHLLGLQDVETPMPCEAREDREVIDKMGFSNPVYRHDVPTMFRWPGFRNVEPHQVETPGGDLGEGQSSLDDFDGVSR